MISLDQITFVITTFKSENVIFDCLSELPSVSPKIIIENSGNNILKAEQLLNRILIQLSEGTEEYNLVLRKLKDGGLIEN